MEMGMVGLGRMGGNMVERLLGKGHRMIAFDTSPDLVAACEGKGAAGARSLEALVGAFEERPRVIWVMVPAGDPTKETIARLAELGESGDIIIDGGNTNWKLALEDAGRVRARGLHYMDAGTSGGIWGLENGYCLMVGAEDAVYEHCLPLLRDLAPPAGGLTHTGPEGSGHFVKMVHNGVEYGLMQAYAEGFDIMKGSQSFPDLDLHAVAECWRVGSVVRSWLLDLVAEGLGQDPELSRLRGYVEDTGEGRWTVEAAIEEAVPAPVITSSLFARFRSRVDDSFADRMLAMMRHEFGGHAVTPEKTPGS
ncbi:MAG: phosphogluconate dehydrogenase (NAD(+)-dependent, decarboxylating) [Candidatus Dormibacteraceae bacterium]